MCLVFAFFSACRGARGTLAGRSRPCGRCGGTEETGLRHLRVSLCLSVSVCQATGATVVRRPRLRPRLFLSVRQTTYGYGPTVVRGKAAHGWCALQAYPSCWARWMGAGASSPKAAKAAKAGFDTADKDRDGKLDAPELKAFLEGAGATSWSDKRVGHLLGAMDVNGDGVVDRSEFGAVCQQMCDVFALLASDSGATAAGPRVFTAAKYVQAWTQLEGTPEAAAIERFGLVLVQGMSELRALFALFLFNPANQGDHPKYGKMPLLFEEEAAAARQPVLDRLILLKQQALPLIAQVDACTEQAYARVPGEPASIAAAQSGATQPIPECFEGLCLNENVPKDKWSPEVSAGVEEAARMISSGEHKVEAVHVDAGDSCWAMVFFAPEKYKQISPLLYLLAQHLLISARFHAQMEALLSPHGEYRAARMKSHTRCNAKTNPAAGDYSAAALKAEGIEVHEPLCRHLKDVLRCTLVLADHAALGKAHAALLVKHTPVGTKDRRLLPPRDVLQTVWFEGLIVEVQFHFAAGARPQRSVRAPSLCSRHCPHRRPSHPLTQ
eukprot:scaffold24606_cov63-Phaeocystis_antarctica.AAC.1